MHQEELSSFNPKEVFQYRDIMVLLKIFNKFPSRITLRILRTANYHLKIFKILQNFEIYLKLNLFRIYPLRILSKPIKWNLYRSIWINQGILSKTPFREWIRIKWEKKLKTKTNLFKIWRIIKNLLKNNVNKNLKNIWIKLNTILRVKFTTK